MALHESALRGCRRIPSSGGWYPVHCRSVEHVQYSGSFATITANTPLGQEFTPALSSLDVVELFTNKPGAFTPVNLLINIRSDTISGPIPGTSFIVTMPSLDTFTEFDFPSHVFLTPGLLYVIEIKQLSGTELLVRFPRMWGCLSSWESDTFRNSRRFW